MIQNNITLCKVQL